jgi:hypothetical protein
MLRTLIPTALRRALAYLRRNLASWFADWIVWFAALSALNAAAMLLAAILHH